MLSRILASLGLLIALAVSSAWAQEVAPIKPPRVVLTWVAPYAIDESYDKLTTLFPGGAGPRNSLTQVALQFWVPTPSGGLARSSRFGAVTNATIKKFVTWAHQRGIKVLLCVYNGEDGWDWPLASNAFGSNQVKFVNALVAEMKAMGLDGINIDLEGTIANGNGFKVPYVNFIKALRTKMGKASILSIDSFHYVWNAPNQTWWNALMPSVDGIVSMGYDDIGRKPTSTDFPYHSYAYQKSAAGQHPEKLIIGVPSDLNSWQGNAAKVQLDWFVAGTGKTVGGVGIWDAQFPAAAWHGAPVWKNLKSIRGN